MHKILLLLGLLRCEPLYGYELHRIVRAHGELYTDLKKANLYYLLERLAAEGYLRVEAEAGTRGARGERLIYTITEKGQARFDALLREILLTYEPVHTGIDTAVVFLGHLPPAEGIALLADRRRIMQLRREEVRAGLGDVASRGPFVQIAGDHLLSLIDAELAWIDRSLARLQAIDWPDRPGESAHHLLEEQDCQETCE